MKNNKEIKFQNKPIHCNECKSKFQLNDLEEKGYIEHIGKDISVMYCPHCGNEQIL